MDNIKRMDERQAALHEHFPSTHYLHKPENVMRLMEWITFYRRNPSRFVEHYFGIVLHLYQHIILYLMEFVPSFCIVAARSAAKSFLIAIFACKEAILRPGAKIVVASATKKQARLIVSEKIKKELIPKSPLLAAEIDSFKDNQNEIEVIFKNGSSIVVVAANENARGYRATVMIYEEFRMIVKNIIDSVLSPFLYIRQADYLKLPEYSSMVEEPKEVYISSAWYQSHWMWKLIQTLTKIFNFMGTYKSVPYDTVPMMKTYKYESIDSRFQASSGDVPFATHSFREYPIGTQTISSGYAVDYRELQSGNFDGTIAEGISQVQIDMQNKAVYYVIAKLYDALKNAKGVKHFAENSGVTQTAVDEMLKKMRRYGRVNICGDYSVVSQFNDFAGYKTFGANTIPFGADAVAEEIRKTGLLSFYNGSHIVELPNALDFTRMNADKTSYELYMPQGLLFFIPQGKVAPLQIFRRGGMTTMTGDDIVTRQHLTRFDMEIGAGVAEGMEDQIGLLSDTNFEVPSL